MFIVFFGDILIFRKFVGGKGYFFSMDVVFVFGCRFVEFELVGYCRCYIWTRDLRVAFLFYILFCLFIVFIGVSVFRWGVEYGGYVVGR